MGRRKRSLGGYLEGGRADVDSWKPARRCMQVLTITRMRRNLDSEPSHGEHGERAVVSPELIWTLPSLSKPRLGPVYLWIPSPGRVSGARPGLRRPVGPARSSVDARGSVRSYARRSRNSWTRDGSCADRGHAEARHLCRRAWNEARPPGTQGTYPRCRTLFLVCLRCVRRHVCCSPSCSVAARADSLRRARARYSASEAGREPHRIDERERRRRPATRQRDRGAPDSKPVGDHSSSCSRSSSIPAPATCAAKARAPGALSRPKRSRSQSRRPCLLCGQPLRWLMIGRYARIDHRDDRKRLAARAAQRSAERAADLARRNGPQPPPAVRPVFRALS